MNNLIIIAGPTASGKTDISIELAKSIGGEIISADSMQAYKYMDIGSAKISKDEMQGIPHFGIDILDPKEEYNVKAFQNMAKEAIDRIYANDHIPIIVGGTGFYIQAVLYDISFDDEHKNSDYRTKLNDYLEVNGAHLLWQRLEEIDPASAQAIHENNSKRVIRALEYYYETGELFSKHNEIEASKPAAYNNAFFVLTDDRDKLYERIDTRVDKMLNAGLVDEVKLLKNMGLTRDDVSMQGLGYKEIIDFLDGKCSLDEAIYILKRDTRRFAKRQETWFRREKDVTWINRSEHNNDKDMMLDHMLNVIKDRGII